MEHSSSGADDQQEEDDYFPTMTPQEQEVNQKRSSTQLYNEKTEDYYLQKHFSAQY